MIIGEHSVIRTGEPDDAYALMRLYDPGRPHSFLLGPHREVVVPTADELREVLARRDIVTGSFFVVDDKEGEVRGCAVMRAARIESEFAEVIVGLADDAEYGTPLADEALSYIRYLTLVEKKLNKIVANCLLTEQPYRDLLVRNGFQSDGVQRQIMYTLGRYHDLETLSLFRAGGPAAPEGETHEPAPTAT